MNGKFLLLHIISCETNLRLTAFVRMDYLVHVVKIGQCHTGIEFHEFHLTTASSWYPGYVNNQSHRGLKETFSTLYSKKK